MLGSVSVSWGVGIPLVTVAKFYIRWPKLEVADQSGFHFVPAVFSHTGQTHKSIKRLIAEQIRNKLALSEGVVKQSRVRSTMRWWAKKASLYGHR